MEGRIQVISRHMEGQETSQSDPNQGKLQNIWPFAHIPMYASLGFISVYIHENGFKSHVWKITCVFRDDHGNIKGTKIVHGSKESAEGQGRPYICDLPCLVKSSIT